MLTLADLQNPYASLSMEKCIEAEGEFAKHAYVKRLQNPYATLEFFAEQEINSESILQLELPSLDKEIFVSKSDFYRCARKVFLQYEPMRGSRSVLRHEFRAFIKRHETQSGRVRAEILEDLKRFDLSAMGALNPQLNREGDSIARKLQKITLKYSTQD